MVMMKYISTLRPQFPSTWEMLKHFTHAQCKIADKDGCSRLPEAAQGSPNL